MIRNSKMKSVYIVKNAAKGIDEKHKELKKKSLFLLKENEEAVHRYSDTIFDFVDDQDGLFLVISQDRNFFHNFRNSFYKELRLDQERIRLAPNQKRASKEIRVYREHNKKPFILLESAMDGRSMLPFLEEFKQEFKDILIIILLSDIVGETIAQYVEAGADSFITKPFSVNVLVEKIANTLVPPDAIGKKVREGRNLLQAKDFALAYGVAREILEIKAGSPAGLILMGDALKGLEKRQEALKMYLQAEENAEMYLEPLKKIVEFHKEDGSGDGVLRYLLRIDGLSPLHMGRKQEIGEIYFERGDIKKAAKYFIEAVTVAHGQRLPESLQMANDYADKIFAAKESEAEILLGMCAKLSKSYKTSVDWDIYSRLGMLRHRRKDWKGAIQAYTEASLRAPREPNIWFNLGMAYVDGKDYGHASEKFERAIALYPPLYQDNLDAAYIMGKVFIRANRIKNAKRVLQHIHSVQPSYKKVKSLLESIKT